MSSKSNALAARVCQHLSCTGYSSTESARFASLVEKWYRCNGPEWTVERLKSLKQTVKDCLEEGDHGNYRVPPGWATRRNRRGQVRFRDGLVHRVVSTISRSNLVQAESFLRLHTIVKVGKLTPKQREKMVKAIESPPVASIADILTYVKDYKVRRVSGRTLGSIQEKGRNAPPMLKLVGGSKRAPRFNFNSEIKDWSSGTVEVTPVYDKTYPRTTAEAFQWNDYFQFDLDFQQLWSKHPERISQLLVGVSTLPVSKPGITTLHSAPAGVLSLIQEGGAKLRWIANPVLPLQALGEPLKRKLYAFGMARYPEIKSHNQDEGHQDVAHWLEIGKKVWSFDCSSFTDRFPLSYQRIVLERLREMGVADDFDCEAFDLVLSKSWVSKQLNREVRWSVGQPLGYNPSFHLATVTHAVVLDNLDIHRTGLWRVVGDDVVIADETLATNYRDFMEKSGVEINLGKSLISDKYSEFLGKTITSKGVSPSMKVRLLKSSDQVVQNLYFYGPRALKFMQKRERAAALKVFLPNELGGLGWKPSKVPYRNWVLEIAKTEAWAHRLRVKSFLSFHNLESFSRNADTGIVELKSLILRENVPALEKSKDFGILDDSEINLMTGLPVSNPSFYEEAKDERFDEIVNTYTYVIDKLVEYVSSSLDGNSLLDDGTVDHRVIQQQTESWLVNTLLDRISGHPSIIEKESTIGSQSTNFNEVDYDTAKSKSTEEFRRLRRGEKPSENYRNTRSERNRWFE